MQCCPFISWPVLLLSSVFALAFPSDVLNAFCDPPAVAEKPSPCYSFVGLIDLDNDGSSDRKYLHEKFHSAGISIDNEVDDQGLRKPADRRITTRTKFLIVGTIPDPAQATNAMDREAAKRIARHYREMQAEARKAGVRVVPLAALYRFGSLHRSGKPVILGPASKSSSGKTSRIYRRGK